MDVIWIHSIHFPFIFCSIEIRVFEGEKRINSIRTNPSYFHASYFWNWWRMAAAMALASIQPIGYPYLVRSRHHPSPIANPIPRTMHPIRVCHAMRQDHVPRRHPIPRAPWIASAMILSFAWNSFAVMQTRKKKTQLAIVFNLKVSTPRAVCRLQRQNRQNRRKLTWLILAREPFSFKFSNSLSLSTGFVPSAPSSASPSFSVWSIFRYLRMSCLHA